MSSADAPPPSAEPAIAPEDVSARTFPTAFRGFDPVEVRAFLVQVADELRAAGEREAELRRALDEAGAAAAATDPAVAEAAAAQARAEAEAIVEEARSEADRLLREAKERVAQLGHAATAESARVLEEARAQAQHLIRAKTEDAEATTVRRIADAEREAAAIRVKAREDADAILEAAKQRGREMIAEAQAARERMIADIAKRKRVATAQLEQLRGGRDRLLESLRVVRRNLDELTTRLEATEGVAPPVAATPAAKEEAPQDATESATRRPARATRVMLGELPPREARGLQRADEPAAADSVAQVGAAAGPASAAVGHAGDEERREPVEERRSSALRILRRNRGTSRDLPPVTPPQIGRESAGEGVRIIGRSDPEPARGVAAPQPEPAPIAPQPEPEPAAPEPEAVAPEAVEVIGAPDVEQEPSGAVPAEARDVHEEVQAGPDDEPPPLEMTTEIADVADVADVADAPVALPAESSGEPAAETRSGGDQHALDEVPDVADDELPPPLRVEEFRPRIEDLFARIRADRERAVASAREVLADDDRAGLEDGDAGPAEPEQPQGTTDGDEHALQARDAVLDPLVAQLAKRLKRSIQDEQNATLDRLRTARPGAGASDILASPETQPAAYRYAALPMLEDAARAAAAAAPFGAVGVGVDDLAQTLAEELSTQIRTKVDKVMAQAAGDDVELQTTSERVSAVYREWKTQRVERIAMHYLVAAWSRGTFVATPEGTPMRWIVDDDGPCPDCDDNALAGATPRGSPFPTGQLHPPAHPGCRCLLQLAHG